MDKERIEQIINELDNLSYKFSDNEVIIACYISIRYGTDNFKSDIGNIELDKIFKEISKCSSIFDKALNYKIDKILNNKEN